MQLVARENRQLVETRKPDRRALYRVLTLEEAGADYRTLEPEDVPLDLRFTFPAITLESGQTIGQVPEILNIPGERFGLTEKQSGTDHV